jgi:RNA polymerase sigma-70 factor (ECF subfamily)
MTLDDAELVRRIRNDAGMYEVLMRRYNQRLYRVARAIVRDDGEAEDVLQQAYLNAYLHLDQFGGRAALSTWLTRITVNEALARARKRGRGEQVEESVMERQESRGPDPEHQAFAGELRGLIESAVDDLPEAFRVVFMLREVEGLSTAETADCLQINEDTVKTRLHRARTQLREALAERVGSAAPAAFQFHAVRCDRVVRFVMARIAALPVGGGQLTRN